MADTIIVDNIKNIPSNFYGFDVKIYKIHKTGFGLTFYTYHSTVMLRNSIHAYFRYENLNINDCAFGLTLENSYPTKQPFHIN